MEIEKVIEFIKEVDRLKTVKRKTLNYHEDRYENSAEHSWHLTISVLAFATFSNEKIDLLKAVKMALVHDVVEIEAGDQIVYAEDPDKFERELEAAKKIFGILPEEISKEFIDTWVQFEKKKCPESKFVGALDRFLPFYSNVIKDGHSWKKHNITLDMILNKNKEAMKQGSEQLWSQAEKMLDSSLEKGFLK